MLVSPQATLGLEVTQVVSGRALSASQVCVSAWSLLTSPH